MDTLGKVIIKNVYYNKSSLYHWEPIINKYSLYSVFVPNNTKNKNSVDITLVVDAMALLYKRPDLYGFCIVASDADYTALAKQIKTENKYVLGIGEAKTPETFRNACSRFICIEDLVTPVSTPKQLISASDTALLRLLIKAYKQVIKEGTQDAAGRPTLREIWERMKALDAEFSTEYQQIVKFINKVKALAAIYPNNIALEAQPDRKPTAHYLQLKDGKDKKVSGEITKLREAYEHSLKRLKVKNQNGWVALAVIGTVLHELYPDDTYLIYGGVKHNQLNKVVRKMMADHPTIIELNTNKQAYQIRFKK